MLIILEKKAVWRRDATVQGETCHAVCGAMLRRNVRDATPPVVRIVVFRGVKIPLESVTYNLPVRDVTGSGKACESA